MERSRVPTPRAWMGQAPYPWPSFRSIDDGDVLRACYYVVEYRADTTRAGQPYLRLRLADRHGLLEGMVWEEVEACAPHVRQGGYVGVSGRIGSYNGRKQIRIDTIVALRVEPEEAEHFLPRGERDPADMEGELRASIGSIGDPALRAVVERVLDPAEETGRLFRRAPAAKRNHHAYVGGLIEHTLSVAGACDRLAAHYGADVDRDLLLAGALLHDIGKTREIALAPGFPYTDEGRLVGHIVMGLADVEQAALTVPELGEARRTLLLHLIASHQGRYEWQSPREPLILEAVLLHYADDLDAKVAQVRGRLADAPKGGWSDYDRSLGREFLRHVGEAKPSEAPSEAPPDHASPADRTPDPASPADRTPHPASPADRTPDHGTPADRTLDDAPSRTPPSPSLFDRIP